VGKIDPLTQRLHGSRNTALLDWNSDRRLSSRQTVSIGREEEGREKRVKKGGWRAARGILEGEKRFMKGFHP